MNLPAVQQQYFPMAGGLDQLTPAISLPPGKVFDSQNYEPEISGGYRRIDGFERFDGRTSPTSAVYWLARMVLIPYKTVDIGDTLTGLTSAATAKVLAVTDIFRGNTGIAVYYLVLGRVVGTFVAAETIQVAAVTVSTSLSIPQPFSEVDPGNDADYRLLAANDLRTDILAVPGSGQIRGIWVYGDNKYAFRDSADGTYGAMYKATAGGWSLVAFNFELTVASLAVLSAAVTITIASPGVVSYTSHPFANGQPVKLSTTGALPTGLDTITTYYVVAQSAGTFELALTVGGTPIITTGTQSGTHTCTAIGNTVAAGNTITGKTSGAIGVVKAALLRVGSWTAGLGGTLVITVTSGTFQSGEALSVGGIFVAQTASLATQIVRAPGGRLEFVNANFTGSTATQKMYGADGVNTAFEFDGTTYVPIHTGMTTDTPAHIFEHSKYLFLSFLGSVQLSGIGAPYSWSIVLGAAEIALGEEVTGFMATGGTAAGSALAIFTKSKTDILYGSSTSNFQLVPSVYDIGYHAFTLQAVSNNTYGLTDRGIQALLTTLTYGDFDYASISHLVQTFMSARRGLETASTAIHCKNQYRLYFSDGYCIVVGLTGDKVSGLMPLNYGIPVRCITTATLSNGQEVTYFGSDDGYVYQDNIGTSFDGLQIEALIRLAFNHSKSPRVRKRYRRATFEVRVERYSKVDIGYDLGYANHDVSPPVGMTNSQVRTGGFWDQFTWDQFTWDGRVVSDISMALDGTEKNISFLFYSNRAQDSSHTVQGATISFTPQRAER